MNVSKDPMSVDRTKNAVTQLAHICVEIFSCAAPATNLMKLGQDVKVNICLELFYIYDPRKNLCH